MPTSFENSVGAPATIRLFGKDLQAGPVTLANLAAVAAEIRAGIPDPFPPLAIMLGQLPPDRALAIFREVSQQHQQATTPNPERCLAWCVDCASNFGFLLWTLLEERYRGQFSRDQIFREIIRLRLEKTSEYLAILQLVCSTSGVGVMGELIAAGTPVIPHLPPAEKTTGSELNGKLNGQGGSDSAGENVSGGTLSAPEMPADVPSPPMQLPA
jgi:hypothetical protein